MNSLTDISSNRGDETSSSSSSTTGEILVRFYTNHENIRIPSEPIAVPSNINRIGLGAIITHLLGKGKLYYYEPVVLNGICSPYSLVETWMGSKLNSDDSAGSTFSPKIPITELTNIN